SRFARTRAGVTGRFFLGARTRLDAAGAFLDMPFADSPGPLTRPEFDADPRQAAARYVATDAGKASRQVQAGAGLTHETAVGTLRVGGWGLTRSLENPLPFAYIRLDRRAGGASVQFGQARPRFTWSIGADAGTMHDDRRNFDNRQGAPGSQVLLDQQETVRNHAVFARLRLRQGRFGAHAATRYDRLRFEARDRLVTNGDESGTRTFGAWSPSAGATLDLGGAATAFVNVSTSFETPTTTELTNRPDGAGGFNPALDPQHTRGGEAGVRGQHGAVAFDVAAYRYAVRGLIAPFQTAAGGERTFYRNEGESRHTGLEGALGWSLSDRTGARMSYAYTRARFAGGPVDGRAVPAVPEHTVRAEMWHRIGPLRVAADLDAARGYPADDANTAHTDAYAALNLHAGAAFRTGDVYLTPFLSVRNLTDVRYTGAVTVNAAGGRFFEPAPGRVLHFGLQIGWGSGADL
ncbi:MAG TPA: TonB-dependent receptor, partial [Rhodothermales bacterium]|nr:TonB-dependent receptor [Rhodothermales bacterium]